MAAALASRIGGRGCWPRGITAIAVWRLAPSRPAHIVVSRMDPARTSDKVPDGPAQPRTSATGRGTGLRAHGARRTANVPPYGAHGTRLRDRGARLGDSGARLWQADSPPARPAGTVDDCTA